jgi:hypothetical protein
MLNTAARGDSIARRRRRPPPHPRATSLQPYTARRWCFVNSQFLQINLLLGNIHEIKGSLMQRPRQSVT